MLFSIHLVTNNNRVLCFMSKCHFSELNGDIQAKQITLISCQIRNVTVVVFGQ